MLEQHVAKNQHGGLLGGEVAGIEQPETGIRRPTGHRMLDLGGHKDIRSLMKSCLCQIGAGAAANSGHRHLFGPCPGFQYPGRRTRLPEPVKKGGSADRLEQRTDPAETTAGIAFFARRHQRPDTRQAQRLGEMIADAALNRVKIGVAGDDAHAAAESGSNEPTGGGIGAHGFQRPENNGMMGDNQVELPGGGLINQRGSGIKGQQDTPHALARVADQQADVIPFLGQVFRGDLLENCQEISNCRHVCYFVTKKRHIPLEMYLFSSIAGNTPHCFSTGSQKLFNIFNVGPKVARARNIRPTLSK